MAEFNPFEDTDEPDAPPPAEELPKKRGRPRKVDASAATRDGTKHIGGNFPKQVSTELQRVCVEIEERTGIKCSIQALLARGINHVLRQAGRQPIAKED